MNATPHAVARPPAQSLYLLIALMPFADFAQAGVVGIGAVPVMGSIAAGPQEYVGVATLDAFVATSAIALHRYRWRFSDAQRWLSPSWAVPPKGRGDSTASHTAGPTSGRMTSPDLIQSLGAGDAGLGGSVQYGSSAAAAPGRLACAGRQRLTVDHIRKRKSPLC